MGSTGRTSMRTSAPRACCAERRRREDQGGRASGPHDSHEPSPDALTPHNLSREPERSWGVSASGEGYDNARSVDAAGADNSASMSWIDRPRVSKPMNQKAAAPSTYQNAK
jgi:hypothetical protein